MKVNGGYCFVDCAGLELNTDVSQTIAGLYNACKSAMATKKPIIAAGATWNGDYMTPIPIFLTVIDGIIIATASTLQVWVTSENVATVHNMAPQG